MLAKLLLIVATVTVFLSAIVVVGFFIDFVVSLIKRKKLEKEIKELILKMMPELKAKVAEKKRENSEE